MDNSIVDFFCSELQLAVELHGESHYGNEERDEVRQKKLEKFNVSVFQFDDLEVTKNLDLLSKAIKE